MNLSGKIWDIVQPTNEWGVNYAHMEYRRIWWDQLWQAVTWIEVKNG